MKETLNLGRKLRIFIAENDLRKGDVAEALDVSEVTVGHWLRHNKKPHAKNALSIRDYTQGYITMSDMGYPED